jgi:hypothetical protein
MRVLHSEFTQFLISDKWQTQLMTSMLRYLAPVAVVSKTSCPIIPLPSTLHHTASPRVVYCTIRSVVSVNCPSWYKFRRKPSQNPILWSGSSSVRISSYKSWCQSDEYTALDVFGVTAQRIITPFVHKLRTYKFLKLLIMSVVQLLIHGFTISPFHTHSQISTTTSKLICIVGIPVKPPLFYVMHRLRSEAWKLFIITNAIC